MTTPRQAHIDCSRPRVKAKTRQMCEEAKTNGGAALQMGGGDDLLRHLLSKIGYLMLAD
jgi:hypothetical protein